MLDEAKTSPDLTQSFTPEQRKAINEFLEPLVDAVLDAINTKAPQIMAMDTRPKTVYTAEKPDVFMPYVAQGMLEDIIAMLQVHV